MHLSTISWFVCLMSIVASVHGQVLIRFSSQAANFGQFPRTIEVLQTETFIFEWPRQGGVRLYSQENPQAGNSPCDGSEVDRSGRYTTTLTVTPTPKTVLYYLERDEDDEELCKIYRVMFIIRPPPAGNQPTSAPTPLASNVNPNPDFIAPVLPGEREDGLVIGIVVAGSGALVLSLAVFEKSRRAKLAKEYHKAQGVQVAAAVPHQQNGSFDQQMYSDTYNQQQQQPVQTGQGAPSATTSMAHGNQYNQALKGRFANARARQAWKHVSSTLSRPWSVFEGFNSAQQRNSKQVTVAQQQEIVAFIQQRDPTVHDPEAYVQQLSTQYDQRELAQTLYHRYNSLPGSMSDYLEETTGRPL